jgi:superfamily II DNA helicase RecQ
LGEVPVIGLTATATPKVQEDILKIWDVWCDYFQSIIQQT